MSHGERGLVESTSTNQTSLVQVNERDLRFTATVQISPVDSSKILLCSHFIKHTQFNEICPPCRCSRTIWDYDDVSVKNPNFPINKRRAKTKFRVGRTRARRNGGVSPLLVRNVEKARPSPGKMTIERVVRSREQCPRRGVFARARDRSTARRINAPKITHLPARFPTDILQE